MAEEGDGHSDSGSDGPPSRTNGQAKVGHVMGSSGWSRDGVTWLGSRYGSRGWSRNAGSRGWSRDGSRDWSRGWSRLGHVLIT